MHVKLTVPPEMQSRKQFADAYGLWLKYDGCSGKALCGAGDGGVAVRFDGMEPGQYEFVPAKFLQEI